MRKRNFSLSKHELKQRIRSCFFEFSRTLISNTRSRHCQHKASASSANEYLYCFGVFLNILYSIFINWYNLQYKGNLFGLDIKILLAIRLIRSGKSRITYCAKIDYPRTQRTELLFVLLLLFVLPSVKFTFRAFVTEFSVLDQW